MILSRLTKFKSVMCLFFVFVGIVCIAETISIEKNKIVDQVQDVIFSRESGFYDEPFALEISASGGEVYYTLDGSIPTKESMHYTEPIWIDDASDHPNVLSARTDLSAGFLTEMIEKYSFADPMYKVPDYRVDKCTVVRAVIYREDHTVSEVKTASYFVGFKEKTGYENMNVLSIVTDPYNLLDEEEGIYVLGNEFEEYLTEIDEDSKAKYWWWWKSNYSRRKSEEKSANFQFFDENKELILSQAGGINIHGGGSRGKVQKSFNLYARKEYDQNKKWKADLFGTGFYPSRLTLFQGGDDDEGKIKDYLMNTLCRDLDFSTCSFVPYAVFLDGEYWGIYWLNEKYDKRFLHDRYQVDKDNVIMVKNGKLEEGAEDEAGQEADLALYEEMMDFCENADMTAPDAFEQLSAYLDMDSTIDYFAALLYASRNGDWPDGNIACWRSRHVDEDPYSDGKWRWMLFDVNSGGMSWNTIDLDSIGSAMENSTMFGNLMNCDEFRIRLMRRIIEMDDEVFSAGNVLGAIDHFQDIMDVPMKTNIRRFWGEGQYHRYQDKVYEVKTFFVERKKYIQTIANKYLY